MFKSLMTISAALTIVSLGSLVSDRAQAGGSQSAPTKTSGASQVATMSQQRNDQQAPCLGMTCFGVTDYSSSSASPASPGNKAPFKR